MMIHVTAILTAKPGRVADLRAVFDYIVPLVNTEPGCIAYAMHVDAPTIDNMNNRRMAGEDAIVLVEQWESPEALSAHGLHAHTAELRKRLSGIVESSNVYVLSPL
jgi:quinol monooxygenase YgiN